MKRVSQASEIRRILMKCLPTSCKPLGVYTNMLIASVLESKQIWRYFGKIRFNTQVSTPRKEMIYIHPLPTLIAKLKVKIN